MSERDLGISEEAFAELTRQFQEVLAELSADRTLDKFRTEYEKLHNALKKSYESEQRIIKQCIELNSEVEQNVAKVDAALKLSKDDQATIASLKSEIEKAWKMVDISHEKEKSASETITALKAEIGNLSKLVDLGAGLASEPSHCMRDLVRMKDQLSLERDILLSDVAKLRAELVESEESKLEAERQVLYSRDKISELEDEIQVKINEGQRETRKRERVERDLKMASSELQNKGIEIKTLSSHCEKQKQDIIKLEQQLKDQRILNERAIKDADLLNQRFQKLQSDFETQLISLDQLAQENQSKCSELKQREEEVATLKQECQRLSKIRENIQKKLNSLEEQKLEMESAKDTLKSVINGLERDIDIKKKELESSRKSYDDLLRERDIINKNLMKANSATQKQIHLVQIHEVTVRNLKNELLGFNNEAKKQRKIINQLEKERDRFINESSDLTQKVLNHMEEIKLRELSIFEYQKHITEIESRLRQQQNLYETVRNDRNLYSKNLIEAQDEMREMRNKMKILTHQLEQMREDLHHKDSMLLKESMERQRIEKERDTLKTQLQKLKEQCDAFAANIIEQENEHKRLLNLLNEADTERLKQKRHMEEVLNERDTLGAQLVRRNDELALLYEKIKIQQSILSKGEKQYSKRIDDIRILKLEIKKVRREKTHLKKRVSNVDDLRNQLFFVQKELLHAKTQFRALEEELDRPMNIHRWRKLEACDPSRYELIKKVQVLQRRLINKSNEVVSKELMITERDQLYIELKRVLARQPGPELVEQVAIYQRTLSKKSKQLKAMSAEMNFQESQATEYRYQVDRMSKELQDVKTKYFKQKKIEHENNKRNQNELIANRLNRNNSQKMGAGFQITNKPTRLL